MDNQPQLAWNVPADALAAPDMWDWLICPRCSTVQAHKPPAAITGPTVRDHYEGLQCPRCKAFSRTLTHCDSVARARAFQHRADNPPPPPGRRGEGKPRPAYGGKSSYGAKPAYSRPVEVDPFAGRAFFYTYAYTAADGTRCYGEAMCQGMHPTQAKRDMERELGLPDNVSLWIVSVCEMKAGDAAVVAPLIRPGKRYTHGG